MHHFIYSSKDSWITSGSDLYTEIGESWQERNFGQDEILEVKKVFFDTKLDTFPPNL